ncbi:MAG: gliding motility-associated C-terminal domain-containing protein [Saprospiraceae bacterium]|nr:gliding motility-associated C-terminal domain-containing protein [Saprospiraceae bacterium]
MIDANGCVSEKQIEVFLRKKASELFIIKSDTVINCINNGIQITGLAGELLTDYYWTTPGNIIIKDSTTRANGGGWYKYIITNQWGCSVSDSIFINDIRKLPQVQIPDTSINCLIKEQQINPISTEKNLQFSWMGPGGFQSNISNPIISIPGIYSVSITNAAGCRLVEQVVLSADTSGPVLKVAKQDISCQRDSAFVLMSSDKSNTQYAWSGPQSFLSNSDRFSTVDTGTYLCIATDPQNGCSTLITVDIKKDTNNIKNIGLTQEDNYCNKSTGSIQFKDIIGGTEPLLYSIDGGKSFSNSALFENLPAGIYELVIQDANGCSFSRQIEIKDILGHKVALGNEIILSLDAKKTIQIQSSSDSTAFVNILWSPSDQLSCENCWSPVVTGTKDETIYLTVTDTNGCTYQTQINIKINQEAFISIPNIFSPNGDQINDYFYPQGNEQIQIELFEVYDRWGGLVFRTSEAKINVPEDGWNGTYKGALLNPAVFVYVIKAKHPLQEWILSGEINLIR